MSQNQGVFFSHSNSNLVTEAEARNRAFFPLESTSYKPVYNGTLIDMIRDGADRWIHASPLKTQYAMNKTGTRMFGTMTFDMGFPGRMLNFGFGNSYDKSMSLRFVSGAQIFICDNLCYNGDAVSWVRKHTTHVMRDLEIKVKEAIQKAEAQFYEMNDKLIAFKEIPISQNRGFELLGLASGQKVLPETAISVAREDWIKPRHEEFEERTAYSLYNCFTEGCKKGEAGKRIERQIKTHAFFEREAKRAKALNKFITYYVPPIVLSIDPSLKELCS